ncbi:MULTISPECIES: DNA repair protein RecN [unclassified Clostridioides]|uniref:DNA repair protein RecN n=2 Tax=Clostridioides TaxID=1870884 RepID=UPI001D0C85D6|nr:DNA repair protein RecN [Clostridioides sp. ES-S-0001-02]MCC0640512.1 DNA repair protein RecN [Clostridioides sp. ES-S-0049-03]MCC0657507.1 DNA repair protein RecN [Clostridioides sp. ES-S-0123-01]MCC0672913.1 DNA repair protein RecN [Clostridioides sp. ES-S-0145-01]MCC0676819.1 DNA repair protein RecN [Clostridioides sp. ES-W-0018-02]MCC0694088.1 DNA repair protein RecN [Clostridioides sp. ES-S-0048-02]MCC0703261.1 DNA repair protein RecN [Clostridioides sp. ES-S-0049-02]MCC0708334.1 DNA
MILELYMKNCALVEELRLGIDKNLNILTGETGSGKSIIIDALGLCLGEKYDRSFLRKGTDKGLVEAIFFSDNVYLKKILDENDISIEDDNLLVITRLIYSDGKSTARVNGRTVKVSFLKEIASTLIDIHGQHQNQALFNKDTHLKFLDLFGENELDKFKDDYRKIYYKYSEVKRALNSLTENKDDMQIQREIDLLRFQINEIEAANLNKNEYEDLLKQRDVYRNSEKIYNNLNLSYSKLHNGEYNVIDLIGIASKELNDISKYDSVLSEYSETIERIMYELQDISSDIRNYKDNIDFEPYELEQIELRIDEINNLRRKYGDSIEAIFEYYEKTKDRLDEILNRDERVEQLKNQLIKIEEELKVKASKLTKARNKVAIQLEEVLLDELKSLNMKNVMFKVNFEESSFTLNGIDDIEFMISFNLGEDIKPIYKVASGGEMSRFMLAFKTILADIDDIDTLVFDEIDTGISGIAAQIVGEKLSDIAKKKQIICITHLPQIAANADTHYCIEKDTSNNRTFTNVKKLNQSQRKNEIARLIAGNNITEKTIEHASEIIEMAKKC